MSEAKPVFILTEATAKVVRNVGDNNRISTIESFWNSTVVPEVSVHSNHPLTELGYNYMSLSEWRISNQHF